MNWCRTASMPWRSAMKTLMTMPTSGDALLSLLVGKRDVTGDKRIRERHRGYALASASTLNRMELGDPEEAANHRYKRVVVA